MSWNTLILQKNLYYQTLLAMLFQHFIWFSTKKTSMEMEAIFMTSSRFQQNWDITAFLLSTLMIRWAEEIDASHCAFLSDTIIDGSQERKVFDDIGNCAHTSHTQPAQQSPKSAKLHRDFFLNNLVITKCSVSQTESSYWRSFADKLYSSVL